MKSKIIKIMVATVLIFSIWACSRNQPNISDELQKSFYKIIPISDMNSSLHVKVISDGKTENKFGFDVNVIAENHSKQQILLPADKSITRLFIVRKDQWVEIKDKYITIGEAGILAPNGKPGEKWITWVRPELTTNIKSDGKQEIMRIVIIGELMSEGKKPGIPVGAYVDLFMEP